MVLEVGESKIKALADLVSGEDPTSWFIDGHFLTVSSHGRRGEGAFWEKALIPFMRDPPSLSNHTKSPSQYYHFRG